MWIMDIFVGKVGVFVVVYKPFGILTFLLVSYWNTSFWQMTMFLGFFKVAKCNLLNKDVLKYDDIAHMVFYLLC